MDVFVCVCLCVCLCVCVCMCVCHATQADPLWQPSAADVAGGQSPKVGPRFIKACHLSASPDTPLSAALTQKDQMKDYCHSETIHEDLYDQMRNKYGFFKIIMCCVGSFTYLIFHCFNIITMTSLFHSGHTVQLKLSLKLF